MVDVVVVGGGVVGLSSAWRLARAGAQVVLLDDSGPAASDVAAGMLAPVTEAAFGEDAVLRLGLHALDRYETFLTDLEQAGRVTVPLRRHGTLSVGLTADDRTALARLAAYRERLGLGVERLTSRQARRREPFLSTAVGGAVLAPDDLSVDNRSLRTALRHSAVAAGTHLVHDRAARLEVLHRRVVAVTTATGRRLDADVVVLAGGARSASLGGVPPRCRPPVVPVKGHILRLRPQPGRPATAAVTHTVRALVHGRQVYLVPRSSGELVVGATVEHQGHDDTVVVAAVRELLRDAQEVVPVVDELALTEVSTGLRPGSPDNGPVLGWTPLPGLFVATGHHRHGILLAGSTGAEVARQVGGSPPSAVWAPFDPRRFIHPTEEATA